MYYKKNSFLEIKLTYVTAAKECQQEKIKHVHCIQEPHS